MTRLRRKADHVAVRWTGENVDELTRTFASLRSLEASGIHATDDPNVLIVEFIPDGHISKSAHPGDWIYRTDYGGLAVAKADSLGREFELIE